MGYGWSYHRAKREYQKIKEEFVIDVVSVVIGLTIAYAMIYIFTGGGR